MAKILNFMTKEEKEFAYIWNMASEEQRLYALASYILKYNDRNIANKICKKELNDIQYQQFKRTLYKYL